MRVCHGFTAVFDDPNLVSCAGLAPVLQLAQRAGLQRLVAEHVRIDKPGGVNPDLKVASLVAGMVAGADSIDDMALLRHGGELGVADLARRSGLSRQQTRTVLGRLVEAGVVDALGSGKSILYRGRRQHPLHGQLRDLFRAEDERWHEVGDAVRTLTIKPPV